MYKKQLTHSNNINYLLFEPTHDNKHVTIIIYHGWGSSIYNQTFHELALASGEIAKSHLSLTLYPHINHSISLPMLENIVNWIEEKFVITKNTHQL
ncbi:hypothetical protein [Bacillus multifaciens]|uniref:hypothetical protein n=1 Tax=Bacillus multifaciens TaxID=3068506 RepID=UPI002740694C|nr:hypothetical protein [Bacillus sp. WLY-B-L8]MDP7977730.1 hypothetical protein [Bacillus sp. WLY-B-L8]